MRRIPVGATSSSQIRESWHHLPTDEMTHRRSRRAEPVLGPQHGKDHGSPHFRKDVGPVMFNYINYRHLEIFTELDIFSTSHFHHRSDHCRDLCLEKTNHPSAQSTTIAFDKHHFVPPCFFRTKKHFVRGGDVEGASWWIWLEWRPT